jgi:O-antigen ligase
MLEFIKRNSHFFLILLSWVAIGWVVPKAMLGVIPLTLLLFKQKNRFSEMLIGFLFILILSDSRQYEIDFAKDVKDIYLVMMTLFMFFDQKQFKHKNTFFYPFIPFFVLAALLISRGPEPDVALKKTLSYALLYITVPAYINKVLDENPRQFFKDLIPFLNILLLIGFILIPVAFDRVFLAGRYSGILGNPNGIGIFCTLYFLIFYAITIKYPDLFDRNEQRLTYMLALGSILIAVSRNSMFSVILFIFFARFYKISYWAGFTIVIVAAISYQLLMNNLESILASLGLSEYLRADHIEDGSGRIVAWRFAWEQIQSQYLFGKGFSYDEYIFWENHEALSKLGHQGGVHSTYLALWLNTGLTGLVLYFVAFIRVFFKAAAKSYLAIPILYAILFSITFEAWLMGSLNPYNIMFLILLNVLYHDPQPALEEKSLVPQL